MGTAKASGSAGKAAAAGKWLQNPKMTRLLRPETLKLRLPKWFNYDVEATKLSAFMAGNVQLTKSAEGKYLNVTTGDRFDAEGLPLVRTCVPRGYLAHFQLPAAVSLLLRFLLEVSVVLLLAFCCAVPVLQDNIGRMQVRNDCRALALSVWSAANGTAPIMTPRGMPGGLLHAQVVSSLRRPPRPPNGTAPEISALDELMLQYLTDGCGIINGVREEIEAVPWYLMAGRGSCEEYNDVTDDIQIDPLHADGDPFIDKPGAAYCVDASEKSGIEWLASVGVTAVFLLFLLRLRRLQRVECMVYDQDWLTASDFAAFVELLPRRVADTPPPPVAAAAAATATSTAADDDVEAAGAAAAIIEAAAAAGSAGSAAAAVHASLEGPRGLEKQLLAELETLGFAADDIMHLEVARDCQREARLLDAIAKHQVEQHELEARLMLAYGAAAARGGGATAAEKAAESGGGGDAAGGASAGREAAAGGDDEDDVSLERLEASLRSAKQQYSTAERELRQLEETTHFSTGHAFVTFARQADMHRFVELCAQPPWWAVALQRAGLLAHRQPSATREAAATGSIEPPTESTPLSAAAVASLAAASPAAASSAAASCCAACRPAWCERAVDAVRARASRPAALLKTRLLQRAAVSVAPEPSAVNWHSLEASDAERRSRILWTYLGVLLLLALNACMIVALKTAKRLEGFQDHFSDSVSEVSWPLDARLIATRWPSDCHLNAT